MRGQVVQHDMDLEVTGHVQIDPLEEREHVLGGVTLAGLVQHLAGSDVHRREQDDGAVALVVMGHRAGPARLERQRRLSPIQRLARRLLVEAEHHRPLRRIQIEANDIDELVFEAGIVCNVSSTIASIVAWGISGLRPRPDAIDPTASNLRRHRRTVSGVVAHSRAIASFAAPSATNNKADACITQRCGSDDDPAIRSNSTRCSRDTFNGGAITNGVLPP